MPLATDEIAISLGSETIRLRPTLRAAFRLERKYEGFQNLSRDVALGNLSAFVDLIEAGSTNPLAVSIYLAYIDENPMLINLLELRDPLFKFILKLAGADGAPADGKASTPIPFEEYFAKLFRIATGWLGWTPEQAWRATPAEIIEAHRGRTEMFAAIFGGNDSEENTTADIGSIRDRLNAIGNQNIHSMAEVP